MERAHFVRSFCYSGMPQEFRLSRRSGKAMTEIQRTVLITIFIGIAITLVTSVLVLTQSVYMIQIMMNVLPSRNLDTLIAISLVVGLAYVLNAVLEYLRARIVEAAAFRIEAIVNHKVVKDYLTGSDDDSLNISALKDVALFRSVATSRVASSIFELILVPFIVAVIFFVNVTLGIVFLGGVFVYLAIVLAQEAATRPSVPVLQKISSEGNYFLERELNRAQLPSGAVLHGAFARRYLDVNRRLMGSLVPSRKLEGVFNGVKMVMRLVLQSLLLGVGAYLAINQQMEIGIVIGLSIISSRALSPIDGLISGWSVLVDAKAAVARLSETLKARQNSKPKLPLPRPKGSLSVENLTYEPATAGRPLLKNVSFSVEPGEILGVIGVTTSGKSTLLKILSGDIAPTEGKVRLDGNEIRNWSRTELELYTGYMPQEAFLLDGTVAETIARFDPGMDSKHIVQAAADAGVHEIILSYPKGYNTPLGPKGVPIAAGHRQFIALARALYRRPSIVYLDEPNANLDAEGDRRLAAVLKALKERGTTVILVTQRPGVLELVDRVLVLNKGEVQTIGVPGEVVNLPNRRVQSA